METAAAELVDAAVTARVLVFGSLPPAGRDLDLLVRPAEEAALARLLAEAGFLRRGHKWGRFGSATPDVVELVPAATWRLPAAELEALFAEAAPLPGFRHLVRPAPHHSLLISARRLAGTGRTAKTMPPTRADDGGWREAHARAPLWRARRALALLERGVEPGRGARAMALAEERGWTYACRLVVPRPRRGAIVSLSGIDGAGKTSQAQSLVEALGQAGVPAVAVWRPFEGPPALRAAATPVKRALAVLRGAPGDAERSIMAGAGGSTALKEVWTAVLVLVHAVGQRRAALPHVVRGRVVVFDRQNLDAIVRLRFVYGERRRHRLPRVLLRALAPQPRLAWLLDVRPETSYERKRDRWPLDALRRHARLYREEHAGLGVRRVDGERPQEEISAELAAEVWSELR